MNKIFKVKRNSLGQSVVCSEIATSRSKGRVIASALALAVASTVAVQAQATSSYYADTNTQVASQESLLDQLEINSLYDLADQDKQLGEYLKLAIDSAITSDAITDEVAENRAQIKDNHSKIANKADTETVLTLLGSQEKNTRETFADVLNKISTKADTETVDTVKRDLSAESNRINDLNTQVATKADKADVADKADQATVDALTTASNVLIDEIAQNRADIIDTINYANAIADAADQDRAENEANIVELTGYVNSVAEATDKNSIDIATNANDIVELAKNAAASDEQIDRNTNAVINLATATDVLIDEIADNTNDIGKLAVISETTVDEVANNRAQIRYNKEVADALTTASNVLIDEIADNTNDIGKLAVISETTVDEVANNRAQIRDNKAAITKNQADITTLMNRTPAAVDLQPINDKIGALDNSLNDKINKLDDKLSAGVAGAVAIAMMPAPAAGSHYITGGTGFYNGENAVAVGLTGASETGTFTYKIGGSVNSSGSGTFGAGAGYRWK
ncbi:YadA-like family protein [Moraxella bovoculi]|uniref:YadA-like family protein n=1 Tax=Moraxella bovoculi TaxID=386891 RepID=UPI003F505913